jgi:hypothetical protein
VIDLSDVSAALVALIANAAYPSGTAQASVTGSPVRVFAGWPDPQTLADDLKASVAQISVFSLRMERNTSGLNAEWQMVSLNTPTLTATTSGQAVTIGGTVSAPQNVMIAVNGKPYIYGVQAADTLAMIASALAALITVDTPASSTGAVVTVPAAISIKGAIGVQGVAAREVKRQAKQFQISVWANNYATRDMLAGSVDIVLARSPHLALPYTFAARVSYKGSNQDDSEQKAGIYRRDLMYEIEYPSVEIEAEATILGIQENYARTVNGASYPLRTVWSA